MSFPNYCLDPQSLARGAHACNREYGHDGPHVSSTGTVLAAWTDDPEPAPEPRTITWRKDGSGCMWEELEAEFREGRQVERVLERDGDPIVLRGPLRSWGSGSWWWIGGVHVVDRRCTSVTVWLPEVPEVHEWAQDCDEWFPDYRLVATDDGRAWVPDDASDGVITRWYSRDKQEDDATTEELADMGARPIVDRDGKAVQA